MRAADLLGKRSKGERRVILWVAGALVLNGVAARAEIVDRIAAVVDRDVITLSEAEQAAELRALRGQEELSIAEVVERIIEARLVEREVSRYPEESVPQGQIDTVLTSMRASFPSQTAFLDSLIERRLTEGELRLLIGKQMSIQRYLESRFRPLVYVSDEEIQRYYDEVLRPDIEAAGESPLPLGSMEASIRRILEERVFNQRIDEWIGRLKSRSSIRRYVW